MPTTHRVTTFAHLIALTVGVGFLQTAACGDDDLGFGGFGGEGSTTTSSASTKASASASGTSTATSTASATSTTSTTASSTSTTSTTSTATSAASSSSGLMVEICDNEVDDNGDGDIDCDDPTCNGDNGGALGGDCTPIQLIQDGTHVGEAAVDRVFVIGKRVSGGGDVTLWVQEAQGKTAGGHTYPEYGGVEVFVDDLDVASFPDLASAVVGDCVSLSGTPTEFQMVTELADLTSFTRHAAGCGQVPTPYVIDTSAMTFDELASDEDPVAMGDQNGARNEIFEGVLVRVDDVIAFESDNNGDFRVLPAGGLELLRIERFIFSGDATAGQAFTSITGVYDQFMTRYRVLPRSAADIVQ